MPCVFEVAFAVTKGSCRIGVTSVREGGTLVKYNSGLIWTFRKYVYSLELSVC